jgi:hypothetical protein
MEIFFLKAEVFTVKINPGSSEYDEYSKFSSCMWIYLKRI